VTLTNFVDHVLGRFYHQGLVAPDLSKAQRTEIWEKSKVDKLAAFKFAENNYSDNKALLEELRKAIDSKTKTGKTKNLQAGVVTECCYAYGIATAFKLEVFSVAGSASVALPEQLMGTVKEQGFSVRYIYHNKDSSMFLLQGGGPHAVDAILFDLVRGDFLTIEFKEPSAKVSEADLPKYGEGGEIVSDSRFEKRHPGYLRMLQDVVSKSLNIRTLKGHNTKPSDFQQESVTNAIVAALGRADLICTNDKNGYIALVPIADLLSLVRIEGEIRSAGKNSYAIWTPKFFAEVLADESGSIVGSEVHAPVTEKSLGKGRGSDESTRFRIGSLFWAPIAKVRIESSRANIKLTDIRQKRPTIAAKIFFEELDVNVLRGKYPLSD
jgi:hypothetical protein